jgi:hypothetical protein
VNHLDRAFIGGLVGGAGDMTIISSYSLGVPSGKRISFKGGFLGQRAGTTTVTSGYWDTTTSGTNIGVGQGSDAGVTGLSSQQLQSGLPAGFDPKIWTEKSGVNNDLPYLIANPPPK